VAGGCAGPKDSVAQSASAAASGTCTIAQASKALPEAVRETSGLAVSRKHPGVFWTHNDSGGEPEIHAVDAQGTARGRVKVTGVTLTDWEDIESGECDGGSCLYIADIGDNAARRAYVSIYEVKEPELGATEVAPLRLIHARYMDGAQDAEALFRLPSGELYIVTKGRQGAIKLYRYSAAGLNGQGTLQPVREIAGHPRNELDRVTAATASPNGKWVAIRTYANLMVYRTEDLLGTGAPVTTFPLADLKEKQGESVTLADDGVMWLTSEAENKKDKPTIAQLTCVLP
jgi:hypothetical protein